MSTEYRYCEQFAERHSIPSTLISDCDALAIHWLEHSRHVIDLSCGARTETLVCEPTWGLLHAMIDRVYEYTVACFVLYAVGLPSSAEVVARTTVEAAINVMYILNGDRLERLWQYFSDYMATEKRQNQLWLDAISKHKDDDRQVHHRAVEGKEKALNISYDFLYRAFQQMGLAPPTTSDSMWPNLFDRFKSLGKEDSYRTVYAAMCSQAHNDAEDLISKFIVCFSDMPEGETKLASETVGFSRMLIHIGLQYYLEATLGYAECFGLTEAEKELNEGYSIISRQTVDAALRLHRI
jgi:hypothetical protein